jgi:tRNA (guanine37-N1)-methyltransferase
MMHSGPAPFAIDVALVHYPVTNKNGETIGAALTNLDLHDIARACRTFGVGTFFAVTPYHDQQEMAREILAHWRTGHGARANPDRGEALSLVKVCTDLAVLYETVTAARGERPIVLATSANPVGGGWTYDRARTALAQGRPVLLLFGTAWGLAEEVFDDVDGVLPPISGHGGRYNHLSVRSAVSIILDRLLGQRTE